jgi:hypothetical protein
MAMITRNAQSPNTSRNYKSEIDGLKWTPDTLYYYLVHVFFPYLWCCMHYRFLLHPKQLMELGASGRTGAHARRPVVMEHNNGLEVAIIHLQVMEATHAQDLVHRFRIVIAPLVVRINVVNYYLKNSRCRKFLGTQHYKYDKGQ